MPCCDCHKECDEGLLLSVPIKVCCLQRGKIGPEMRTVRGTATPISVMTCPLTLDYFSSSLEATNNSHEVRLN